MNASKLNVSLIELVIVLILLAAIPTITLPRISRGANGTDEAVLSQNLAVLRGAIQMYAADHDGRFPAVVTFKEQVTRYSDEHGRTSPIRDQAAGRVYGPYLHQIPALTIGDHAGANGVASSAGPDVGWLYDETTGHISANVSVGLRGSNGVSYAEW